MRQMGVDILRFKRTNVGNGSYKLKKQWDLFDRTNFNGSLLEKGSLFYVLFRTASVFDADFLFVGI
ncbi:hypothetical protein [Candidatus Azobacteroides pseudotrichonymphae]|uniref:hypothetical protein n=1 Tax=Candidatus Azobacteroides pseudotrichonymphae TaxID=511435 RepID=UPI00031B63FF|nr:hypothetical protein [Candidatus Azobacteroides pseudotrichonymphae]